MADTKTMFYQSRCLNMKGHTFDFSGGSDLNSPFADNEMCLHLFGAVTFPSCSNYVLSRTTVKIQTATGKMQLIS